MTNLPFYADKAHFAFKTYRKIDIYIDGNYYKSTNAFKTCKAARQYLIDKFIAKYPDIVTHKIEAKFS